MDYNKSKYLIRESLCCLGKIDTEEQKNEIKDTQLKITPCFYNLEGTIEELFKKHHRQIITVLAKMVSEHTDNKHLNIDYIELIKEWSEKYKITNIQ